LRSGKYVVITVALFRKVLYNRRRMVENILRSVMSGLIAGETLFLVLYPGYATEFGDKMRAFKISLRPALAAFAIFALMIFVVGLLGRSS
jgi:hypothetical protein